MIIISAVWGLAVFFGAIKGLSKSFQPAPSSLDSSDVQSQEQKTIDETQQKQKQLMDDLQQKMKDQQARKF